MIHQQKYLKDLLKKFNINDAKPYDTPMSTGGKLDADDKGEDVDEKLYRGIIRSLLYLAASRPDIMFSVCFYARFQGKPKESHLKAVKRIFRYLKGTSDFGLWYPRNTRVDLNVYSDADYAGCLLDRKSTSGICHFVGSCLVSWASKKQNFVALSTTKSEYISCAACCAESLWIYQQFKDLQIDLKGSTIFL